MRRAAALLFLLCAMCDLSKIQYSGLIVWEVGDSITRGDADGVSEVGGCGWRALLRDSLAASGQTPVFVGTLTGGYLCATCPENGLALAHDGHTGFKCTDITADIGGWFTTIGGDFDVMILEAGTNDLLDDQAHGTSNAQGNFDTMLDTAIALNPTARFFVSNLPPSPGLNTAPLGQAFAAHVAAKVAEKAALGIKITLIDHFNGTTPNGSQPTLNQLVGPASVDDFSTGGVHPSGPGGAPVPGFEGYPKMGLITYLTMTHTAP